MEEIWKDVVGYQGFYQISSSGKVKSLLRKVSHRGRLLTVKERLLSLCKSGNGYLVVSLCDRVSTKKRYIHSLVAEAFLKKKDGDNCINHLDLNKENNLVSNLEWTTLAENNRHALRYGKKAVYPCRQGEKSSTFKTTDADVRKMLIMHKEGLGASAIAKKFNLSRHLVYNVVHRKTWKHVDIERDYQNVR